MAPVGTGSGLVRPAGLLFMGPQAPVLEFKIPGPPGSHGAERPPWSLLNRFLASLLQSDSSWILFWSVLPFGTKGKRWKTAQSPLLALVRDPSSCPSSGLWGLSLQPQAGGIQCPCLPRAPNRMGAGCWLHKRECSAAKRLGRVGAPGPEAPA